MFDDFDSFDENVWLPHYLPAWSSRAETAAEYGIADSCLTLRISPERPAWCAGDHEPPTRISGVQSGNWSGPVGSSRGQQPYRAGLVVREFQPVFEGRTPLFGTIEFRARAVLSPRSMAAFWMVGLEDEPDRCAEICVMEVFGDAVVPGAVFSVDGQPVRTCGSPPDYPMQLMLAVFDFPDRSVGADAGLVPEFVVDSVRHRARTA